MKTIASCDLFFFLFGVDMMIQTVVDLHSRCFLVMLLILMARSASFIQLFSYFICLVMRLVVFEQYAVFGKVTRGDETLRKLEEVPTRREGIFVMVLLLLASRENGFVICWSA